MNNNNEPAPAEHQQKHPVPIPKEFGELNIEALAPAPVAAPVPVAAPAPQKTMQEIRFERRQREKADKKIRAEKAIKRKAALRPARVVAPAAVVVPLAARAAAAPAPARPKIVHPDLTLPSILKWPVSTGLWLLLSQLVCFDPFSKGHVLGFALTKTHLQERARELYEMPDAALEDVNCEELLQLIKTGDFTSAFIYASDYSGRFLPHWLLCLF